MNMKKEIKQIAIPITVQSLFQASMNVIDQIMSGQLGEISVAGIGLGGKFTSLYAVIVSAIATAAGILIAQFVGSKEENKVAKNFWMCLGITALIATIFTILAMAIPKNIMGLYSKDVQTVNSAARYLYVTAIGFIPMGITIVLSTLHRSIGFARGPLYASIIAVCVNTALNYMLIFGHVGMPKMGIVGAALATTIARIVELFIVLIFTMYLVIKNKITLKIDEPLIKEEYKTFLFVLVPILISEALWSIGENIYAIIYGRTGTAECAAMTLTTPIQSLMIGAMTGIAAAAGIIVGKSLGEDKEKEAYDVGKKFLRYGFIGTGIFAIMLFFFKDLYVQLFRVDTTVKNMLIDILVVYCVIVIVKVENMIIGRILKSGGKTHIMLIIDAIGTWGFGIPLAVLAAFIWDMPIASIYFFLSLEECIRLLIGLFVFKSKGWIQSLSTKAKTV